jgi:RNA polymerase sigma factor (sigma-70 family)
VRRAVAALPDEQRRLLELRYGFDGRPHSLEAIAEELGTSRERLRRLEADAYEQLASVLDLADAA